MKPSEMADNFVSSIVLKSHTATLTNLKQYNWIKIILLAFEII